MAGFIWLAVFCGVSSAQDAPVAQASASEGRPQLTAPFTATEASEAQTAWAKSLGREVVEKNSSGIEFVLIPPGKFRMGSPRGERSRDDDEDQVDVTLTKAFDLGKTEVTQAQWRIVMGTTPWKGREYIREGDNFPATHVSWEDAQAFCKKLAGLDGGAYRLPTEAEWEFACRAGTSTRFSFSDKVPMGRAGTDPDERPLRDFGWWGGLEGEGNCLRERYPHEVATRKPNPFGVYDLHGNVWEWCQDVYRQQLPGGTDPLQLSGGSVHTFRGGSWVRFASYSRPAMREWYLATPRTFENGFRVARSVAQ